MQIHVQQEVLCNADFDARRSKLMTSTADSSWCSLVSHGANLVYKKTREGKIY